jgi:hypothetical protein
MNNHFEDLRQNLAEYRNADFGNINILNNLKNYLNYWVYQFRRMMPINFTIPGNWNQNQTLNETVYRLSNSMLFDNGSHPDIIRWVLIINNLIDNHLVNIVNNYVPEAPLLWRQNDNFVLDL